MLVFQSGKVVTVAHNDGGAQVKTFTEDGFTIEGNQQFTGANFVAFFDMRREVFTVKFDGINTDVNQDLNAAVAE
ncbi:hypothetical protein D3C73_1300930 [compost metagenome]